MTDPTGSPVLRIGIAAPEQIRAGSSGEVTVPETVDYGTLKPMPGGLYCERIFGPVQGRACRCSGTPAAPLWIIDEASKDRIVCPVCGVISLRSQLYGERMGHITLAAPSAIPGTARAIRGPYRC